MHIRQSDRARSVLWIVPLLDLAFLEILHHRLDLRIRRKQPRSARSRLPRATNISIAQRRIRGGRIYGFMLASALRTGASERRIKPEYGWVSSNMRKTAPATEIAPTPNVMRRVTWHRANRPNPRKSTDTQNVSTASKYQETDWPSCSYISIRTWVRLDASCH